MLEGPWWPESCPGPHGSSHKSRVRAHERSAATGTARGSAGMTESCAERGVVPGTDRFLAHWGLIGVSCGVAMAEAGLLIALAPAARALAPQVTALPPLAIFHDLRWLYSTQRSWLWFTLLLAGLLLARSAVNTVLVRLAWPASGGEPAPLEALGCALGFTVFAC